MIRYLARRALTNEPLDWDLSINTTGPTHELSGPGDLTGTIEPDLGQMVADDGRLLLEEWGTLIYEEIDGVITWGGIVVSSSFSGKTWTVECAGQTTYAHGTPWQGTIREAGAEPVDLVRRIWAGIQAQPDSDLGFVVVGPSTQTRLGTAEDPYELLWQDTPDCGSEIDKLAGDGPFDFVERHSWIGNTQQIRHEIVIGYPRLGRRRTDLAFEQGVNVSAVVTPKREGDDFANEVVGLGAGEGEGALRRTTAVRDGRLRRTTVLAAKAETDSTRLDSMIAAELRRRQNTLQIDAIQVDDIDDGTFATWDLGDDVLVTADLPHLGHVELWCRITSWRRLTETRAVLTLTRTDSYTYGG